MSPRDVDRITQGAATKAEKVRRLHAAGCTRSEIAAALGISYQHVRNALSSTPGGWQPPPELAAVPLLAAERETPYGGWPVRDDGTVVVPAWAVRQLGGQPGRTVAFSVEADGIHLLSPSGALAYAQRRVAEATSGDTTSWSDEFVADRRREKDRE